MNMVKEYISKFRSMSTPMKASFAFVVCSFLQRGISTLTTPIFTRLLTTEQYGFYSIFNSWLEIIAVFTTLKLAGGVFTQALVKYDSRKDELTASTAGLGTAISLIVIAVYLPLRKYVNSLFGMSTAIMMCIFIASWATLMFEIWSAQQRVEYKYKALVALTIVTSVAKPIFGIIAVLATDVYKAEARIISLVIVEVICYSGLFFLFIKRGKGLYNRFFWKYSLSLNLPLIPHYLTRTILNQSDRLMIRVMVNYSCAGIYSLAHNLAWMLSLFTNAILNSFNPWIYQKIKNKQYDQIARNSYLILIVVAILGLGLISLSPEIVLVFAPENYYDAIWVIPPITASVYFLFMYSLYADFEFYFEKSKFMAIASTTGGVINIILNFFFIRWWGYIAAGYTTLFCYIFYAITHYLCMKKVIKENIGEIQVYDMRIIVLISCAFLFCGGVMMALYTHSVIRYAIIITSAVVIVVNRKYVVKLLMAIRTKV